MTSRVRIGPQLLLEGAEGGAVFVVDRKGNRIWRLHVKSLQVSEAIDSAAQFQIEAWGVSVERDE